jgi:serine/threonine protein kinase
MRKSQKVKSKSRIDTFNFQTGLIFSKKYQVLKQIGTGWEGEVYLIKELSTGIECTGKFFFPQRNINNKTAKVYANKLYKLRHCPLLIKYHTQEAFWYRGHRITYLVSEYVEGELLSEFIARQSGKRLPVFQGMHLLYELAKGMEVIHHSREYHGDLHTDNIIVQRVGLGFDLKLFDVFHWHSYPRPVNILDDVVDMIKIFYDSIGGSKMYKKHPDIVKRIACGMRRSLIQKKYRTAGQLRTYLETMRW